MMGTITYLKKHQQGIGDDDGQRDASYSPSLLFDSLPVEPHLHRTVTPREPTVTTRSKVFQIAPLPDVSLST
jgi:hypothetical protein